MFKNQSGSPTFYLLPGPGIDFPEIVERGPRIKRMMIERGAAGPGDIEKTDLAREEPRDGRLVGGVRAPPRRSLLAASPQSPAPGREKSRGPAARSASESACSGRAAARALGTRSG